MINAETIEENVAVDSMTEHSRSFSGHLADAWDHAVEATDAQFALYLLKATRVIVMTMFCGITFVALSALAGYGFWLLDGCFAYALSHPSLPVWLAPLIRGSMYLGAPLAVSLYIWNTMVGFDAESGGRATVAKPTPEAGEHHATL
ncbi:MAG TPA: hypothetical protein VGP72_02170 [Planctomycetota bacterium]|jgi:hypothetical protein